MTRSSLRPSIPLLLLALSHLLLAPPAWTDDHRFNVETPGQAFPKLRKLIAQGRVTGDLTPARRHAQELFWQTHTWKEHNAGDNGYSELFALKDEIKGIQRQLTAGLLAGVLDPATSPRQFARPAIKFVRKLPSDVSIAEDFLLPSEVRALGALPAPKRALLRRIALKTYARTPTAAPPSEWFEKPDVTARNAETVITLASQRTLKGLMRSLPPRMSETTLSKRLDRHFARVNGTRLGSRGGYGFQTVLAAAKAIQRTFGSYLDQDERHIVIYGSFPNLKADLKRSDIDTIFSDDLMLHYDRIYGEDGSYAVFPEPTRSYPPGSAIATMMAEETARQRAFHGALHQTVAAVARTIGRTIEDPEKLMLIRWQGDHWRKLENQSQYNPVTIKVTSDRITVRVYDHFGGTGLREVVVTD